MGCHEDVNHPTNPELNRLIMKWAHDTLRPSSTDVGLWDPIILVKSFQPRVAQLLTVATSENARPEKRIRTVGIQRQVRLRNKLTAMRVLWQHL